jgi:Spy/CpxP family protein refolding chaperone
MRSYQKEIIYFIAIALVAFGAFYVCGNFFKPPHHNQIDAHVWLHEQIGITAEQDQKLFEIEKNFAEKQGELREKIHVGNLELAAAMLEDKAFSERVAAAVERIHHAQGELQKLTIEHIFDMQTVLTPQQAEKLNKLAADALIQNP